MQGQCPLRMVLIVSEGVTLMKDEPEVHVLEWFLMRKGRRLGL